MVRFSGTQFRNAHEALGSLFQVGSIEEYIKEFEALSALIPHEYEEQYIGMFLRGLKHGIRNWVRALNPGSCDQAMEFARHVAIATSGPLEKTTKFRSSSTLGNTSSTTSTWNRPYSKSDTSVAQPNLPAKPNPSFSPPFPTRSATSNLSRMSRTQHLSKSEWEERRKLGLCFGCGQKYTPQHKCASGKLRILLLANGDKVSADGEVRLVELDEPDDPPVDGECQSLELCEVITESSSSDLKTLKIMGEIHGFPALILINSGATQFSLP